MTFVVNAIKQDFQGLKKPQNIKLLLGIDSPLFARKFIEKSGLVLLSLSEYTGLPQSFGSFYVEVVFETQQIQIIGYKDFGIKDLCVLFLSCGLEIVSGDSFVEPEGLESFLKTLVSYKKEFEEQQNIANIQYKEQSEKQIYYQNDGLEKAKLVIAWAMEKVDSLLIEKGAFISAKDLRLIKEKVEELKKLRMGTNYEKIRDMLQDLFLMVDNIEEDYYNSLENSSPSIFPLTTVCEVDVERQISVLEKIKQQKQFGGAVSAQRKDYVVFGKLLVYILFLKKDFIRFLKDFLKLFYRVFDLLQIGILMLIIVLSFGVLYAFLFENSISLNSIYSAFFSLGFLGIISFCFSLIHAKNPLFVFLLLIIMFIIYFIGLPLLQHTFVLS